MVAKLKQTHAAKFFDRDGPDFGSVTAQLYELGVHNLEYFCLSFFPFPMLIRVDV